MRVAQTNLFSEFEPVIRALPVRERLERADLLIPSLRLHQEDSLEMYYAPFGTVNASAAVVLLGITPGWRQMEIAYRVARRDAELGVSGEEICRRAKQDASFAGTMRTNLVRMLDELGAPPFLGIESTSELFGPATAFVHTASAIRYPVFVKGRNYTGHPDMLRNGFLRQCVESILGPELARVPNALIVPLGNAVSAALTVSILRVVEMYLRSAASSGFRILLAPMLDGCGTLPLANNSLRRRWRSTSEECRTERLQATAGGGRLPLAPAAPDPQRSAAGAAWI